MVFYRKGYEMQNWFSEIDAVGRTFRHTDGTLGVCVRIAGGVALIEWEDGQKSWTAEYEVVAA